MSLFLKSEPLLGLISKLVAIYKCSFWLIVVQVEKVRKILERAPNAVFEGGGQRVAFLARHRARFAWPHACAYGWAPAARLETPFSHGLYKTHTFVCDLDRPI
jgi:hypothetical protein